jgi:hypothetical protein
MSDTIEAAEQLFDKPKPAPDNTYQMEQRRMYQNYLRLKAERLQREAEAIPDQA